MLPQVGQGAIAIECRSDDVAVSDLLGAIDHRQTHRELTAERAFLAHLGGGCDLPVGAFAVLEPEGRLEVEGLVASVDGRILLRRRMTSAGPDDDPRVGRNVAQYLLDEGGRTLLGAPAAR
jgi:hydroxymethylbilane synthase